MSKKYVMPEGLTFDEQMKWYKAETKRLNKQTALIWKIVAAVWVFIGVLWGIEFLPRLMT